jgi:hypothetical protein
MAAAGSSAAVMFPLFITHDKYFVQCGGSGGGYHDVFDLSSYKLLSEWQKCDSSAAAAGSVAAVLAARQWWQQSGGSMAVAARRQQHGSGGSAAAARRQAAWRRCRPVQLQHGSGKRGGGVGSTAAAALAARQQWLAWRLRRKFGSIAASVVAAEQGELRCGHVPPQWRQRHRWQQRWRGHYQQSTIN